MVGLDFKHKAIIQKDGEIVLEVNEESRPKIYGYGYKDTTLKDWQSKHQYVKFASKENENKAKDYVLDKNNGASNFRQG